MSKENFFYIYDDIINNINLTFLDIKQSIENIDDDSKKQINGIIQFLKDVKNSMLESINELKENSNWDSYTIAFYGETGAGKSTIIETLRILLKEQKKIKEQEYFIKTQSQINNLAHDLKAMDSKKQASAGKKKDIENQTLEIKLCKQKIFSDLRESRKQLNNIIRTNIWKIQISKVIKCFKDKREAKENLKTNQNSRNKQFQEYNEQLLFAKNEIKGLIEELQNIETHMQALKTAIDKNTAEIQEFSDGHIIGTGESDYTQKTSSYNFDNFYMLDMPGIQGNEKKVEKEFKLALQQSHIVFYVTKSPTPPQSGHGQTLGTIEKIKQHLGDQTQVYAIYNKSVNNPRSLSDNLAENNHMALLEMDNAFKSTLGEQYCGHIVVSGLPAFCACSQYFSNEEKIIEIKTTKEKLLDKFSYDELLEKSGIKKFIELLQNEIISDAQLKIVAANKNKVSKNIDGIISNIKQEESNLEKFYDSIKNHEQNAKDAIRKNFDSAKKDISNIFSNKAFELEIKIRESAYAFIETNVSNKKLQDKLELLRKEHIEIISNQINTEITSKCTEYNKNVKEDLKSFEMYVKDVEAAFDFNAKNDINCEIKTKSGIKMTGLILGGIGITFVLINFWNPVGWTAAMRLLIAVVKFVWGYFSTSDKKSKQRKAVDNVLADVQRIFKESTSQNKNEIIKKVKENNDCITVKLDCIINNIGKAIEIVKTFRKSLQKIKSTV